MTGVDVLGEIDCIDRVAGFSIIGLIFAIITMFLMVLFSVEFFKDNKACIAIFFIAVFSGFISACSFSTAVEIPCTHYLIHMSNNAGYNDFNSTYNILDEICDGYYIVEKIEEQDVASDE